MTYLQSSFAECYNRGINGGGESRGGIHLDLGTPGKCTGKSVNSETRREGCRSRRMDRVKNLGKQQRVDTAHGANESQDKQGT